MIDRLDVRILYAATVTIDHTWTSRDVCSSFWRMYLNNRDGASVLTNAGPYQITADRVHFVPAWVTFTCRNATPVRNSYVHFDLIGLASPVVRRVFPQPSCANGRAAALRRRADALFPSDNPIDQPARLCEIKSMVLAELARLFRSLPQPSQAALSHSLAAQSSFNALTEYIETHLAAPLDNADLARRSGLSESHFTRCFHAELGMSPARYVRERRVAAAAQRLAFSNDPIDLIAETTGFANRFHFSRIFRQLMGVPPAAYRRQQIV